MIFSKFLRSILIRINFFHTNRLWVKLKADQTFTRYFPDKFKKYTPPKEYFWKVYSQVFSEKFKNLVKSSEQTLRRIVNLKQENLSLTQEAIEIHKEFIEKSLTLLSKLKR